MEKSTTFGGSFIENMAEMYDALKGIKNVAFEVENITINDQKETITYVVTFTQKY